MWLKVEETKGDISFKEWMRAGGRMNKAEREVELRETVSGGKKQDRKWCR